MAFKPVQGKLLKTIRFDIVGSITLGLVFGQAYWTYYHVPTQNTIATFYDKLEAQKKEKKEA